MQRTKDLDTVELLDQLPALQQLLYRVLGCQVTIVLFCMASFFYGVSAIKHFIFCNLDCFDPDIHMHGHLKSSCSPKEQRFIIILYN